MGMNPREWEEMGLKKTLPLISSTQYYNQSINIPYCRHMPIEEQEREKKTHNYIYLTHELLELV